MREVLVRIKSGVGVRGFALLGVGLLLGFLVSQSFTYFREQSGLKSARQRAEALFRTLAPRAEMQLRFLNDRLDEIRKQVARGIVATNSGSVAVGGYEAQQKRIEVELEQVDHVLGQLAAFADQAARDFKLRTDVELLAAEHQQKMVELQTRYDNTRTGTLLLASEVSYAKERQLKMALAEAQATQLVQAEALRQAQAEAEAAERARTEAMQRMQTEPVQRAQAEAAQRAQAEAAQRSQTEALQRLLEIALLRTQPETPACRTVYVQPAYPYANDFLVIGQRYHAAYLGRRYNPYFYYSDYSPCYGSYGSRWFY
jgi:chemotaxis protein histidine kinase CheA